MPWSWFSFLCGAAAGVITGFILLALLTHAAVDDAVADAREQWLVEHDYKE